MHLRPFSATFVLRMCKNGYLWTSGVNLDTAVRFADLDFLLECKISAIWRRFPWIIAFYMLNVHCPPYFYFRFCSTYWPRKYTTRVDPHVDNSHQVWSWYDCRVIAFVCWYVTWLCDLDFWPFDLEQLPCMAGHVTNLATKFEDPTPISSWLMSHKVSRWLPLRMRTQPLRMRRITWPVSRGSKTIIFLESPTLICLFTMHLQWLYDECN